MPRLWLYPDLPVYKKDKYALQDVTINDGLHFNGFLLTPPVSRFKGDVLTEVGRAKYLRHGITGIHLEPVNRTVDLVGDYALKTLKRRKVDLDGMLILPRTVGELPRSGTAPAPQRSASQDLQAAYSVSPAVAEAWLRRRSGGV